MNPERMIADLEATARDLADRSREVRDRIRRAEATHRSADGVVTATVAPNGSLRHIEFSPGAARFSHDRLGEVVLDTVRRAQAQAARQVVSEVEPQFAGTVAMGFLTGAVPTGEAVAEVAEVAGPVRAPESVGAESAGAEPAGAELALPRSLWAPDEDPGTGTAAR